LLANWLQNDTFIFDKCVFKASDYNMIEICDTVHAFCEICGTEGIKMKEIRKHNSSSHIVVLCSDCLHDMKTAFVVEFG
jgi:hypothetical protein